MSSKYSNETVPISYYLHKHDVRLVMHHYLIMNNQQNIYGKHGAVIAKKPCVALLVTCLVDLFRPAVGFAAVKLLEEAGYNVEVPEQSCCGQPNYNNGDRAGARAMALQLVDIFQPYDYVVVPSGSCAGMLRVHYPALFKPGSKSRERADDLAGRTHELTSFLHGIAGVTEVQAQLFAKVTYHDGCAGLREMRVRDQPRALLATVDGLELAELNEPDVCCGFGGTFCVKYPDISERIIEKKIADIRSTGADYVLAGDLGCLLTIGGKLHRDGSTIVACHVAEVLAGMASAKADADD